MSTTPEAPPDAPALPAHADPELDESPETALTIALQPDSNDTGDGNSKSTRNLTPIQRAAILECKRRNPALSYAQIGATFGVSRQAVAKTLANAHAHVADVMRSASLAMVTVWEEAAQVAAQKGYHQPAKDYLLHAGVIDPVDTGTGTRVNVGVQLVVPGLPGAGAPLATFAPCAPFALTGEGGESETTVMIEGKGVESDKAHYVNSEVQVNTGVPGEERKGGEGEHG